MQCVDVLNFVSVTRPDSQVTAAESLSLQCVVSLTADCESLILFFPVCHHLCWLTASPHVHFCVFWGELLPFLLLSILLLFLKPAGLKLITPTNIPVSCRWPSWLEALFYLDCASIHSILINTTSQDCLERISSNLVHTHTHTHDSDSRMNWSEYVSGKISPKRAVQWQLDSL